MLSRGENFKQIPINVVGSSVFGRYPKMSSEVTYNMFISDQWLVDYAGYQVAIASSSFVNGGKGRGLYTSTKLNRIIAVVGNTIYKVEIFFDQNLQKTRDKSVEIIGTIATSTGVVYITENNVPQIVISDGHNLYVYDPNNQHGHTFYTATQDGASPSTSPLLFTPGYVSFHDNYIHVAASNNTNYSPPANNTWYISSINDTTGMIYFPFDPQNVGVLATKPDNIQAVIPFPSHGNMVLVLGEIVGETWGDQGLQLFPYTKSTAYNFDYGCLNPATIAYSDEIVVWLAQNEKSGPIIVYTRGQGIEKITTDGIDYLFSQLHNPSDSQGFLYRQDGHLIYHINFYTDNFSLFYDFNTGKFFNACDENLNYFIANQVVFFNNQYYFLSNNNGNMYAFDTIYTTYDGEEIPRFRICQSVRLPTQEYFVANDFGFTIEQGETPFQKEDGGAIDLITQDGKLIITQGSAKFLESQDNMLLITQNNLQLIAQDTDSSTFFNLIDQNKLVLNILPRVDLSISIDGGISFGSDFPYIMNAPGHRKNKMQWWNLGLANDFTIQLKFWGLGRFVAFEGVLNIRQ